jgi:hypothetical protein
MDDTIAHHQFRKRVVADQAVMGRLSAGFTAAWEYW